MNTEPSTNQVTNKVKVCGQKNEQTARWTDLKQYAPNHSNCSIFTSNNSQAWK